ncbi:uncharacterized protein BDZ99DRAFT_375675, partial [Mytilinidion resinicola]
RFIDSIRILGYNNIDIIISALPINRMRFQYPWADNLEHCYIFGLIPFTAQVLGIIETARKYNYSLGVSEDK